MISGLQDIFEKNKKMKKFNRILSNMYVSSLVLADKVVLTHFWVIMFVFFFFFCDKSNTKLYSKDCKNDLNIFSFGTTCEYCISSRLFHKHCTVKELKMWRKNCQKNKLNINWKWIKRNQGGRFCLVNNNLLVFHCSVLFYLTEIQFLAIPLWTRF